MNDLIYAYMAGLIDGEGTIALVKKGRTNRQPSLSVSSTTYELVNFCKENFEGCICTHKKYKTIHKTAYSWRIGNERAISLLRQTLPYMKEPEKIRKTKLLLESYQLFTKRNGWYTEEEMQQREAFEKEFFKNNPKVKLGIVSATSRRKNGS